MKKIFLLLALTLIAWFWLRSEPQPSQNETVEVSKKAEEKDEKKVPTEPKQARRPSSFIVRNTDDFILRYPGRWNFRKAHDGSIKTITGGLIKATSYEGLAYELKPLLASGEYDLSTKSNTAASSRVQTTLLEQKVGDLAVYQGALTFLSRKKDEKVYIINNQLKEITEFEKDPRLPLLNAQNIVVGMYPDGNITPPPSAVVFALNGKPSELAWVFNVDLKTDFKEVVISALDGRVLHEELKTVHD